MTNEDIAHRSTALLLALRNEGVDLGDVLNILVSSLANLAVNNGVTKVEYMENVENAYDQVSRHRGQQQ